MIYSRNTAKAVIVEDNSVLLLKKQYEDGSIKYTLPGGTQEPGEALKQTVVREAFEEVGAKVSVVKLLNIYEHQRDSKKRAGDISHKIEFAFLCEINGEYQPQMGKAPDSHQIAVEWVKFHSLDLLELSPASLAEIIKSYTLEQKNIYLGDIS